VGSAARAAYFIRTFLQLETLMMRLKFAALSLLGTALTSPVWAQHADIAPRVENGKIVTDGWLDALSALETEVRVFGYDFQEDPLDPYFASDPGFNARPGSGLPAGSQLLFNIVSGARFGMSANLSYWDGLGAVAFGGVPGAESLALNLGAQTRIVDSSLGDVAGFSLGTIGGGGTIHRHLNSFLAGGPGGPADGIYLFAIELFTSDPSVGKSDPCFIVFNNGLGESAHDLAIAYVESHLVPEPPALVLAVFGGTLTMVLSWRRRRARRWQPLD
jgi:hypothetical protein